jgi:hypothetical protein
MWLKRVRVAAPLTTLPRRDSMMGFFAARSTPEPRRKHDTAVRVVCMLVASLAGCAADGGTTPTRAGSAGTQAVPVPTQGPLGGSGLNGQAGTAFQNPVSIANAAGAAASMKDGGAGSPLTPPPAAGCAPTALDQVGCACDKIGSTRPCYSADPMTRSVGVCKDGVQTCMASAGNVEFGAQWSACTEQVVPSVCAAQLDARCVGKVGCADEQCIDKLGCAKDAGAPDAGKPDAGNPKCHTVMGFGMGFGLFPDGGMWCER